MTFPYEPNDMRWGNPPWPEKVKGFRPHQVEAIEETLRHFDEGADVVILNAPTGSGKTVIAEAVRRLMNVKRSLYVANTNGLIDQFIDDFGEYAKPLKGRRNYPTLRYPEKFEVDPSGRNWQDQITAADCDKQYLGDGEFECSMCVPWFDCHYEVAKRAALGAKLAVTNTSYLITEANGPGRLTTELNSDGKRVTKPIPFVIIDEADTLEQILMNHIEVAISKRWIKKLKLPVPEKKTVEATWKIWVEQVIRIVDQHKRDWDRQADDIQDDIRAPFTVDEIRERKFVTGLLDKLEMLKINLQLGNAVYDGYGDDEIKFKTIRVNHLGKSFLWRHGMKFLLMSATVIDPQEFAQSLGISDAGLNWQLVDVPSTFPVENRPIHIKPVANMVYKEKDAEWPKLVAGIDDILERHPEDRVLVHTVSYDLAQFIRDRLNTVRPVLVYRSAKDRERVLREFRKTSRAILLAPSMDRGVDLPYDDCRVVIVAKMPFLNLQDKLVKARMFKPGGQLWYSVQTIRSLVQMTGRGVRSETDTCSTYILDQQFANNVWKSNRGLLPGWWKEALDWTGGVMVGVPA